VYAIVYIYISVSSYCVCVWRSRTVLSRIGCSPLDLQRRFKFGISDFKLRPYIGELTACSHSAVIMKSLSRCVEKGITVD
jgi:hypothetical protein